MKLEIDLDLNKIDYDSINEQIKQKIKDLDITNVYTIDDRIRNELDTQISQAIRDNMYRNYWSNELDSKTAENIQNELRILIKEAITPSVNNVFNKISEKEIEKMILDILPKALVALIIDNLKGLFYSFQNDQISLMESIIENHINNRLNNKGN